MPIFSWSALVLGSTATEITGAGKLNRLERDGMIFVADRVAGGDVLQSDRGADVARQNFADVFALVGVHLQQAANALGACRVREFSTESPVFSCPE